MRGMWWYLLYRLGRLNWEKISFKMTARFEGDSEEDMIRDCDKWYADKVRRHVRPEMVDAMTEHRKQGHKILLLTAVTIYLARPLGQDLGVDDYICNRLEVKDGKFTGRLVEPTCYGDGKVLLAKKFTEENDISLSESYFYTDSVTDLPVLEQIGNPVVVNPDPILRREARRRSWPVYDYADPVSRE